MDSNPFQYGRELSRDELVDREPELEEIRRVVRNRGKLFLVGPRRYGKTSVLSAAGEEAVAAGARVLRFDAEKYETLELLAAAILTAAARSLRSPVERAGEWLARAAGSLKPSLEVDPATGSMSVSIGAAADRGELPLLTDALDAVESLAAESDDPVVVILDEVQQIVVEHGEASERQLRATVQRHRHVAYVFAGSATRLLTAMVTDPNRPFYRLGSLAFLGPVPEADFLDFLARSFRASGQVVESGGCERILGLAEGVPYNVQRLAYETWELVRPDPEPVVNGAAVDRALERIVRREDPAYTQVWLSLTRNQKKTLKAVVRTGGEGLQSARVARQFDIAPASVQVALGALEDRHLVRRESGAGSARYRLVDPFFTAWLDVFQ
jgi:hypothetical protein